MPGGCVTSSHVCGGGWQDPSSVYLCNRLSASVGGGDSRFFSVTSPLSTSLSSPHPTHSASRPATVSGVMTTTFMPALCSPVVETACHMYISQSALHGVVTITILAASQPSHEGGDFIIPTLQMGRQRVRAGFTSEKAHPALFIANSLLLWNSTLANPLSGNLFLLFLFPLEAQHVPLLQEACPWAPTPVPRGAGGQYRVA